MILSLRQIEDIGAAVIQDFNKFFYCGSNALGIIKFAQHPSTSSLASTWG